MAKLLSIILILSFSFVAEFHAKPPELERFYSWWKEGGSDMPVYKWDSVKYQSLVEYKDELKFPKDIKKDDYEFKIIYESNEFSIVLAIPLEAIKWGSNESFDETYYKCKDNQSWLIIPQNDKWTKVELNPYCSEGYSIDQVDVTLFWLKEYSKPFVGITSNGPACVPSDLFQYDVKEKKFLLQESKCTD